MSVWLDLLLRYAELNKPIALDDQYDSVNKINSRGDRFEFFIKDLLTGTLDESYDTVEKADELTIDELTVKYTG